MLTANELGDCRVGVGRRVGGSEHQRQEARQLLHGGRRIRRAHFRERLCRGARQVHAVRRIRRPDAQDAEEELDHRV